MFARERAEASLLLAQSTFLSLPPSSLTSLSRSYHYPELSMKHPHAFQVLPLILAKKSTLSSDRWKPWQNLCQRKSTAQKEV